MTGKVLANALKRMATMANSRTDLKTANTPSTTLEVADLVPGLRRGITTNVPKSMTTTDETTTTDQIDTARVVVATTEPPFTAHFSESIQVNCQLRMLLNM